MMDGYKKIIKNKHFRMIILYLLRWVPDKIMLKLQYRIKFRRKLDLSNPKRFTEFIQKYKLDYKNPLMIKCSDKHLVREYVKSKGLEDILIKQYCTFESESDIDFNLLPEKFVLKLSNGSGTNFICRDKLSVNVDDIKKDFKKFKIQVEANAGREWPYTKANPVIVAEELLEDTSYKNNAINDYKILCFNGKPEYIICITERYTDQVNHIVYDTNWINQHVSFEGAYESEGVAKPENFDEMMSIAETLSADFPFARVDLYNIHGKIHFGEITFFPWSGYMEFEPDEFDFILGSKFKL